MYVLHIANKNYSSWSLRPWVMLHMAGVAFEERLHPFSPEGPSRDRFLGFSPTGQVPCLHHAGQVVWESLAILEYLAERHDGFWPSDPAARAYARSISAEMAAGFFALRGQCPMSVGVRVRLNAISEALQRDLDRLDGLFNEGLERFGGPFLAGDAFTIADAMYCPVAWRIRSYDLPLSEAALAYAARLRQLGPMKAWEAAALAETFREPGHDEEIAALGAVIEDRRVAV
ncbi:MAG: glutathione S-transferase family protein [Alphaproteobacteria bacterium]|nr:glutathione S-transferase family protein [Alphaproteobacteria bacterium]